jgi:integrase
MEKLRAVEGVAARALEFLILVAARSGEVRGATWSEIDLNNAVWVVPPERMKARRQHKVPLAPRVIELLRGLPTIQGDDRVFVGGAGGALGSGAMAAVLKQLNPAITIHGCRSSFRDWASEQTAFPEVVAEMALAHAPGSSVEKGYRRTDLFDKRRALMNAWAVFCAFPAADGSGAVIPLRATTTA